jgi:hypothetical protein
MKILLGDFNPKVEREDIVKLPTENGSLHKFSNDNGFRLANFASSKDLTVTSTMFSHPNICKYAWMCPDGKNQSEWPYSDRQRHSNVLDVPSLRAVNCAPNKYLVVNKMSSHISYGGVQSQEVK